MKQVRLQAPLLAYTVLYEKHDMQLVADILTLKAACQPLLLKV